MEEKILRDIDEICDAIKSTIGNKYIVDIVRERGDIDINKKEVILFIAAQLLISASALQYPLSKESTDKLDSAIGAVLGLRYSLSEEDYNGFKH